MKRTNDEIYESEPDDLDSEEVMIYNSGYGPTHRYPEHDREESDEFD